MYDKIIFGKNPTENICAVEIQDDKAILFIESPSGITQQVVNNRFWILAERQVDSSWIRLKGDQFFKWGKQYKSKDAYLAGRTQLYKRNIKFYSPYDDREKFLINYGYTFFKGMKIQDVSVLAFDIETTTLRYGEDSKVLLISTTFRRNGVIERKLFAYDDYPTPKAFIDSWCNYVHEKDPSVLISFNGTSFDLPYLDKYAKDNGTELYLGRDGSAIKFDDRESEFRKDGSQKYKYFKSEVFGRSHIDVFFLAIKHDVTRKYPSYKLKEIIKYEGLEKPDRQYYDAGKIRFNYTIPSEWEKIKRYVIDDSDEALTLFDLMIPPFFYLTSSVPKSFQSIIETASGAQINSMMVRAYLQDGYSIPVASEIEKYEGGISTGIPGIYRNVWKVDIRSSYPTAILTNNLYPKEKDPEAYMYKMCQYFTKQRIEYKQRFKETGDIYYQGRDAAAKIFINSMFGFCSAPGLNFNDSKISARITELGRQFLNTGIKWATSEDKEYWIDLGDKDVE